MQKPGTTDAANMNPAPHFEPVPQLPHLSSRRRSTGTDFYPPKCVKDREHIITELYRKAFENQWDAVASILERFPEEARYIHGDGTTTLHLAIMSRTGYVIDRGVKCCKAPLSIIEDLMKIYPEAARAVCSAHTYSPLTYACLVVDKDCDLSDAENMVRILLKYDPECSKVTTAGGLTALDVHIVSYSQGHQDIFSDDPFSGPTNTAVLRTLLQHDPSLAKVRILGDKVGGAVELLYRSNASAFLEVVSLDDIKKKGKRQPNHDSHDTKDAISEVTKWWVWHWLILLLKYGTLSRKKRGARFHALHAAATLVGCPLPVLTLSMKAFPQQIRQVDEMYGDNANLPLHEVCAWPCEHDISSTDPIISSRKGMAIAALLQEYPEAAHMSNRNLDTPLELAVSAGSTWDFGVRKLCRAYAEAVCVKSKNTLLFPFMTAAAASSMVSSRHPPIPSSKRSLMTHLKNLAKHDVQRVRTIYGLLRANPLVLINCFLQQGDEEISEELPVSELKESGFSPHINDLWASVNLDDKFEWTTF